MLCGGFLLDKSFVLRKVAAKHDNDERGQALFTKKMNLLRPSSLTKLRRLTTAIVVLANSVFGDALVLRTGQVVKGTVLATNKEGYVLKTSSTTVTYPMAMVKNVTIQDTNAALAVTAEAGHRIANWGTVLAALSQQEWAGDLKQVPATVILEGVLSNVPYASFKCGWMGYEVNIYGDPDYPAGFEIGVLKHNLNNAKAKENCVAFTVAMTSDPKDKVNVRKLNLEKDLIESEVMTFEITPPSAPDSYGGWWVTVYDEKALDEARASPDELAQITEPIPQIPSAIARPAPLASQSPSSQAVSSQQPTWTASDFQYIRTPSYSSSTRSSFRGGSVYVKGYVRRDGTYVSGHTRSAPRRR